MAKYLKKIAFVRIITITEDDFIPELPFIMAQFRFNVGHSRVEFVFLSVPCGVEFQIFAVATFWHDIRKITRLFILPVSLADCGRKCKIETDTFTKRIKCVLIVQCLCKDFDPFFFDISAVFDFDEQIAGENVDAEMVLLHVIGDGAEYVGVKRFDFCFFLCVVGIVRALLCHYGL
jgi:hypothetical protein